MWGRVQKLQTGKKGKLSLLKLSDLDSEWAQQRLRGSPAKWRESSLLWRVAVRHKRACCVEVLRLLENSRHL